MRNSLITVINKLNEKEMNALKSIYFFRCLNEDGLYRLHFLKSATGKPLSKEYTRKKIQNFIKLNLIEAIDYGNSLPAYFLTSSGIEIIRYFFDLPTNIYDVNKKVVKRGYYRASELKIFPKNINHQISLNNFIIDFQLKMNNLISWKYYDEKYMSQYLNVRPDGLIQLLDVDFLLEMDMATESQKQLNEKWENYRNFINSREYAYKERKMILLFIIGNTSKVEARKDLVRYTISERLLDIIDSDFEIYIGTQEELIDLLFKKMIPILKGKSLYLHEIKDVLEIGHNFLVSNGEILKNFLHETEYGFYIRKINKKNNIIIENNKIQEFLVDEYLYNPLSVLKKIAYLDRNNSIFKQNFNREISYIILAKSEDDIYHDLKVADLIGIKNIYFTTLDRLKTMNFCEALFQFDFLGNIHHFSDTGLNNRIFEKTML